MKLVTPVSFIALVFLTLQAHAQLDSCNIFLLGNYVEAGINWNGALGTSINAPVNAYIRPCYGEIPNSYACDSTPSICTRKLGLNAHPGKGGWLAGNFWGDYVTCGIPQEGWSIMADGLQANAWNGAGNYTGGYTYQVCDHNISGSNISYSITGSKKIGIWQGTYKTASNHSLKITQVTTLDTNSIYLTMSMTIINKDTGTTNNIYYLRTLNPKNDLTLSGDATTRDVVTSKLPNPKNKVVISTRGTHYPDAFLAFGTEDCRSKAFICTNNLWPTSRIDSIYNGTAPNVNYDSLIADIGIGLIFSLGNLSSGDSLKFSYSYIFKDSMIDYALATNHTNWSFTGDSVQHNSGDTITRCGTVSLNVLNSNYNTWNWYSPSGNYIYPSSGTSVNVLADSAYSVFVAVGTATSPCTLVPDTIIMVIKAKNDMIPAISISGPHSQATGGNVIINATVANAGTSYRLVWRKNGKVILISTVGNSIIYTKPSGNDTITVTVLPSDYCYDSAVSNTWIVYNGLNVQNTNNTTTNIFSYPNPFNNEVTITGLGTSDQLSIYDVMGRKQQAFIITGNGSNTFNTANLLPGVYILRVVDRDGIIKAKIPMQKL